MKKLNAAIIDALVHRIVTILRTRESAVYTSSMADFSKEFDLKILSYHKKITLTSIDANHLLLLSQKNFEHPVMKNLLHAAGYGAEITLVIHSTLCPLLSVKTLSALPFHWCTHTGQPIILWPASLVTYKDVCQFNNAFIVTSPKTIITAMAKDTMITNHITSLCVENEL